MKTLVGIYVFILGTIFASFFGVIIDRVPKGKSIVLPSSKCDECGHVLKWYENIPLISYIVLKGRCSKCKSKIGSFFFVYELIGGLSLFFVYYKFGITLTGLLVAIITLVMLLIAGYDYKTNTILNVTLIVLALSCIALFLYRVCYYKHDYMDYAFSVLLGFIFFFTVRVVMNKLLKKESLGSGDIYLVSIMGIAFEPFEHLLAILISSLVGSIISIALIRNKSIQKDSEIPFGPFLCLGYYLIFIFGNILTNYLLR